MICRNDAGEPIENATVSSRRFDREYKTNSMGVATVPTSEALLPGDSFVIACEAQGHRPSRDNFVMVGSPLNNNVMVRPLQVCVLLKLS